MPNHTANNFTVSGPIEDIRRLIANAKDGDTELSFNKLVPMPEEIRGTSSPVRIQTQQEIDEVWEKWNKSKAEGTLSSYEKDKPFGLGMTRTQYDDLIAKYGCADWHDWAIRNWGTKWSAYDVTKWSINEDGANSSATIYYDTAWSPASIFWLKVSQDYPALEFFHEFADEGGGFLGNETIVTGSVMHEESFDWNSPDGKELREGLGRYWLDEDDEEEYVEPMEDEG
jgi:hypothetical protein